MKLHCDYEKPFNFKHSLALIHIMHILRHLDLYGSPSNKSTVSRPRMEVKPRVIYWAHKI